jgi:hypothetical protein
MDRHPFTDDVDAAAGVDSLLASTLFLLVRHAAAPCPRLADLVERHLAAVASHAGCGILVRETCRHLMSESTRPLPDCPLGFAPRPCQGRR